MQETPTVRNHSQPRLTPEQVEIGVKRATRGDRMTRMMEFQSNPESLNSLPNEAQKRIFLDYAEHDAEETLNFDFLYLDKPFALEILKKAALRSPENAILSISSNLDHPKYQDLHRFMIQRFGEEVVKRELEASEGFFTRVKVYGLFKAIFDVNSMGKPKVKNEQQTTKKPLMK